MSSEATLSTWSLSKHQVNASEKLFLLSCARRAGEEHTCWPSIKRMTEDTGFDRKTIIAIRKRLVKKGLLRITGEMKGKSMQVSVMQLTYVNEENPNQPLIQTKIDLDSTEIGTGTSTNFGTGTSTNFGTLNIKEEKVSRNNKNLVDFQKSTETVKEEKSDYFGRETEEQFEENKCIENTDNFIKSDYLNNQTKKYSISSKNVQEIGKQYKDDALFMLFYTAYPNKQKPVIAYKSFLKHKPDEDFVEMLLLDLKMRMNNNWKYRHKSKIPFPATYLNGFEWEGEIYEPEYQEEIQKLQEPRYGIGRPSAGNVTWI